MKRTITLTDGDVDRITIRRLPGETRLLIFQCEDEPLIQARLSMVERFALSMALSSENRKGLPLAIITVRIEPRAELSDETYEKALVAWQELEVKQRVERLVRTLINTREALDGFRITID